MPAVTAAHPYMHNVHIIQAQSTMCIDSDFEKCSMDFLIMEYVCLCVCQTTKREY